MRKPQRNWMLEEDGSWNERAVCLDHRMGFAWGHIPDNADLKHIRDLLNKDAVLRKMVLELSEQYSKEMQALMKENERLVIEKNKGIFKK